MDNTYVKFPLEMLQHGKLEKLSFTDYTDYLGPMIQYLNPGLKSLRLDQSIMLPDQFGLCLQANPGLCDSLTHLAIGNCRSQLHVQVNYRQLFETIGANLKNLHTLEVLYYKDVSDKLFFLLVFWLIFALFLGTPY